MSPKNISKPADIPENDDHAGETSKPDQSYAVIIEHGEADKLSPQSL